jgi:ribosomal protein S18 acetylase RimI-like enzyme
VSDRSETGGAASGDTGPVHGAQVEAATVVDDELVAAFARLIPQLSKSSPPPSADQLRDIVENPNSVLYLARIDGRIVGALTLAMYRIPTGLKAWIDDVVVEADAGRRGIGEALSRAAIAEAARRGAKSVDLTSRPSREAANRLYARIGFEPRTTNVYRYDLKSAAD